MRTLPELRDALAVGAIEPRAVRLWLRAPDGDDLAVELTDPAGHRARSSLAPGLGPSPRADHTTVVTLPDDAPSLPPLRPDTSYVVRVMREGGSLVGQARFHTPWEDPYPSEGRLVFGLASCHEPFDRAGRLRAESDAMLHAAHDALEAEDARFLLLVGDQIYADHPPTLSLFERRPFQRVAPPGRARIEQCTRDEVRRLYQQRHRAFFAMPSFAALQTLCPTYAMPDDHDVRDNFGTNPLHASPGWQALREGALDAIHDYQTSRVLGRVDARPRSLHYGFTYGPLAVFVLDVRSTRVADERSVRAIDDAQLEAFRAFLRLHAERPFFGIVLTVPIVHVSSPLATALGAVTGLGGNAADRWSHPRLRPDRDRFLRVLREHQRAHPAQRVLLLSGDIHVGCAHRLDWSDGGPPTHQLTSSPLSHLQHPPRSWAFRVLPRTTRHVRIAGGPTARVRRLASEAGASRNPYGGLNVGIVELAWGRHTSVRFRLIGARKRAPFPFVAYASRPFGER